MDRKARRRILKTIKPMIAEFKKAIAEERAKGASEEKIELMLAYVEAKNTFANDEEREFIMGSLREAAWPPHHQGPGTVQ